MRRSNLTAMAFSASLGLLAAPGPALADCLLQQVSEFHVGMASGVPIIGGEVDGQPVKILIDSGATNSLVVRAEGRRLGLDMQRVLGAHIHEVGGETEVLATTIKTLKIGNFSAKDLTMWMTGPPDAAPGVAIVLGDDFLSQYDVEFDLANGAIRLFEPKGCAPEQLVYWGKAYSLAPLLGWPRDNPTIQTDVELNGERVLGELDSGAAVSVVDQSAADAAGAMRDAGSAGDIRGLGQVGRPVWIDRFDSFAYGDEKIGNAHLAVMNLLGDFETDSNSATTIVPNRIEGTPQMLIGADFLRAHRVYVGAKEHVIVFSYNGGPVFLAPATPAATAAAP